MASSTVPVIRCYDEKLATRAYEVHVALTRLERACPELRDNPLWQHHRKDAFADFVIAFERPA